MKAELSGFSPRTERNLDVSIGRTLTVPFTLRVGGLAETVEVVANASTIDTASAAADNSISQDLLANIPINIGNFNAATSVMNFAPGINDGSAFGGDSGYGNALLIDGVDTRDPEAGSAWVFYNFNIIEEVQVGGVGAPAEYGGFSGSVVNTITKSGGNRYSGLFDIRHTNDGLAGDNMNDEYLKLNPSLGSPNVMTKLNDFTVQMGGPFSKDKAWWWFSVQRYAFEQDPSGPSELRTEVSPRYNGKITYNFTPNDQLTGSFQYDNYNVTGRFAFIPSVRRGRDADGQPGLAGSGLELPVPEAVRLVLVPRGEVHRVLGLLLPRPESVAIRHATTARPGAYSGGAGYFYYADRDRNQANISFSTFASAFGQHSFKFGMEIERSGIRSQFGYTNDVYFYDYGGPYLAYGYAYDIRGTNKRESYYAQDQWKIGRLTANLGLRLDHIAGYSPDLNKTVYAPDLAWGPRLGATFDLTGKGTSVLRGSWGRYYEGAGLQPLQPGGGRLDAVPVLRGAAERFAGTVRRDDDRRQLEGRFQPQALQPRRNDAGVRTTAASRSAHRGHRHLADLGQLRRSRDQRARPGRRLPETFRIRRTRPRRSPTRCIGGPTARIRPTRWSPTTPASRYKDPSGNVLGTADPSRKYKGVMFVLTKTLSNRWQGQFSYVWSKSEGNVGNAGRTGFGGTTFRNPNNVLVNSYGVMDQDRPHEFKLMGGYTIPKIDVALNAYYSAISGFTYTPVANVSGSSSVLNWTGSLNINLEPRGSQRMDMQHIVDLRAEKEFRVDVHRLGIYFDVANIFNNDVITSVQTRVPDRSITYADPATGEATSFRVKYRSPTAVLSPIQMTFGARWSF